MEILKEFLTEEQCFDIIVQRKKDFKKSHILGGTINKIRNSRSSFWENDPLLDKKFNYQFVKYQLVEYVKDCHYTWHNDDSLKRIETNIILLNDNFEGGEFELKNYGIIKLNIGDCLNFKSALDHRVKPVTKGIRYSLVTWLYDQSEKPII